MDRHYRGYARERCRKLENKSAERVKIEENYQAIDYWTSSIIYEKFSGFHTEDTNLQFMKSSFENAEASSLPKSAINYYQMSIQSR